MNEKLAKYLSDVFRNEVQNKSSLDFKESELKVGVLTDPKINHFLVDGKYSLRLDEMI